ncbi:reverse transcriptase domain-containing protein [Tanacetum coccineum]
MPTICSVYKRPSNAQCATMLKHSFNKVDQRDRIMVHLTPFVGYGGINPTFACANDTCAKGFRADRNKRFEVPTTFSVQKFESKLPSWLIGSSWAKEVIQEVHEGSCRFNAEPCSMVAKIMKQSYYWPSMHRETAEAIQECTRCQNYSTAARMPNHDMTAVNNAWQFSHYGVNIVGPLPTALEGLKFLAIAIEPSLNSESLRQLLRRKINSSQKEFFQISVDDLPRILWVHRTLPRISQKETPFTLTYESEAIIPKITYLTPEEEKSTTKERAEKRKDDDNEVALIEEAYYKSKLRKYHDTRARARPSTFGPGYFVLLECNNEGTQKQAGERPYIVNEAYENGLYKITSTSDYSVIRTMSGSKLRKFYV